MVITYPEKNFCRPSVIAYASDSECIECMTDKYHGYLLIDKQSMFFVKNLISLCVSVTIGVYYRITWSCHVSIIPIIQWAQVDRLKLDIELACGAGEKYH